MLFLLCLLCDFDEDELRTRKQSKGYVRLFKKIIKSGGEVIIVLERLGKVLGVGRKLESLGFGDRDLTRGQTRHDHTEMIST